MPRPPFFATIALLSGAPGCPPSLASAPDASAPSAAASAPVPVRLVAERVSARPAGLSAERVQRGGSYLCTVSWCHGYRVSARRHSTPDSSLKHVGARCAHNLPPAAPAAHSGPTDG